MLCLAPALSPDFFCNAMNLKADLKKASQLPGKKLSAGKQICQPSQFHVYSS
jgi:hypothetical protein